MTTGAVAALTTLRSGVATAVDPTTALTKDGYATGVVESLAARVTVSVPFVCLLPSLTLKSTRLSVPAPIPVFR
jgi:hypothetical protein